MDICPASRDFLSRAITNPNTTQLHSFHLFEVCEGFLYDCVRRYCGSVGSFRTISVARVLPDPLWLSTRIWQHGGFWLLFLIHTFYRHFFSALSNFRPQNEFVV